MIALGYTPCGGLSSFWNALKKKLNVLPVKVLDLQEVSKGVGLVLGLAQTQLAYVTCA